MKTTINEYDFIRAFEEWHGGQYKNNFSTTGLRALFEEFEQYETDVGEEIELDVVAICCEYNEYENIKEYVDYYMPDIKKEDYDDEDEYKEAIEEHITYNTHLIKITEDLDDGFIIQVY